VTPRPFAVALSLAVLGLACAPAWAQRPLGIYLLPIDYPPGVRPNGTRHSVGIRYDLDRRGRVATCTIARPSDEPELDAASCRILTTRARMRPEPGKMHGELEFVWLGESPASGGPTQPGEPLAYDLGRRIDAADYPEAAAGQSGQVAFAVTVSPAGRPIDCRITESSGVEALDNVTCAIVMTRAVYIPATNGRRPVSGVSHGRIRWVYPG
jgi:TonB family protein